MMLNKYQKSQKNEFSQAIGMNVTLDPVPNVQHCDLQGRIVSLLEMNLKNCDEHHLDSLWSTVVTEPNESCWTYLPYSTFLSQNALVKACQTNFGFPNTMHYLIQVDNRILGWIALMNVRADQGVVEIGNVYFSHRMKQSTASTEVIYLLLKMCFEQGFRRIEWKCDDFNEPSKKAAQRFGFQYEGTFRQDRITKGRNRNTAWFSMLDEEWEILNKAYNAWLKIENFNEHGQQKIKLANFIELYK